MLFTGITIVSGSIWGKPTWGTWWTWDARLTSTAVLFCVYVGYLLLRSLVDDPEARGRYAAVVGILGAVNIPIVHFSVKWWRALHQPSTILGPGPSPIDPAIGLAALRELGGLHPAVRLLPVAADGDRPARGADADAGQLGLRVAAYGMAAVALFGYWRRLARRARAATARPRTAAKTRAA